MQPEANRDARAAKQTKLTTKNIDITAICRAGRLAGRMIQAGAGFYPAHRRQWREPTLVQGTDAVQILDRLTETNGRPTGFDYMRLVLACSVLCMHSVRTSYGLDADQELYHTALRPFIVLILPMFFCLSGFVVAGSLERVATIVTFIGLRVIRIYPALIVEVALSALVLGAFFTDLSYRDYFTHHEFYRYLVNVTGHDIHFHLPGVFETNPDKAIVNVQLWTVPFELECYAAITALSLIGVKKRRILAPLSAFGLLAFEGALRFHRDKQSWYVFQNIMSGRILIVCFLLGISLYLYKDKITYNRILFVICLAAALALCALKNFGEFLAPVPIAYITVYLGLLSPKKIGLLRGADYSYGIYLYGYPIQQAVIQSWQWSRHWYLNIAICLPLAVAFSAMSWHFIEKPALGFKKKLFDFEQRYLSWREMQQRQRKMRAV